MAKQFTVGHFHGLDRILRKVWSAPWNGLIHDAAPRRRDLHFSEFGVSSDYRVRSPLPSRGPEADSAGRSVNFQFPPLGGCSNAN
jgi:hypothetical protein